MLAVIGRGTWDRSISRSKRCYCKCNWNPLKGTL